MRSARVPTVPSLCSRVSSATASACTPSSSTSARRSTSTARKRSGDAYRAIDAAFADYPHAIHYALKANSTLALVRLLRSLGSRADANSRRRDRGGAARRLRAAGHRLHRRRQDARRARVRDRARASARSTPSRPANSIASPRSRARWARGARGAARQPRHRRQEPSEHLHRTQDQQVRRAARRRRARSIATAGAWPSLAFVGVHIHIGSQITIGRAARTRGARAGVAGAGTVRGRLHARARRSRRRPRHRATKGRPMITPADYAAAVLPELRALGIPVVLEPGRAVVGTAGALVSRSRRHQALSGWPAVRRARCRYDRADAPGAVRIVPPHSCRLRRAAAPRAPGTSSGRSARAATSLRASASLPELRVDDLVAVLDTGAYGAVMASNYNRRLLAPEVLVDDDRSR